MKAQYFLFVLLAATLCQEFNGCSKEYGNIKSVEQLSQDRKWGQTANGLRCSILLEKTVFQKDDPLQVAVAIENMSGRDIDLKTIPVFYFNEYQYWCPVDITSNKHLPTNARSNMRLKQGECININIDISKLNWGLGVSSVWPMDNIYSKVPSGKYKLHLDIEICDENDFTRPNWVYSNKVEIVINKD